MAKIRKRDDGLLADIGHLLRASNCGADLRSADLPVAGADWHASVTAGDDYELCFSAPVSARPTLAALEDLCPLSCVGVVSETPGVRVDGVAVESAGFRHF